MRPYFRTPGFYWKSSSTRPLPAWRHISDHFQDLRPLSGIREYLPSFLVASCSRKCPWELEKFRPLAYKCIKGDLLRDFRKEKDNIEGNQARIQGRDHVFYFLNKCGGIGDRMRILNSILDLTTCQDTWSGSISGRNKRHNHVVKNSFPPHC